MDQSEDHVLVQGKLLARHAEMMNQYGADSLEVAEFVTMQAATGNRQFVQLAETAKRLKKALTRR